MSVNNKYNSLYEAALNATYGTTIIIDEGEYIENKQIKIPLGVNIIGKGNVIIKTNYVANNSVDAFLKLETSTIESGSQKISNITLDGDFIAGIGILVSKRSNVTIENCTIKNFTHRGIRFTIGNLDTITEPNYYATNNIVRNCIFIDCSQRTSFGNGSIEGFAQDGLLIYNNRFYLKDMPDGQNGNIMFLNWVKRFKYFNNTSYKSMTEGNVEWNMGIEIWSSRGGNEIYNNEFNGGGCHIDVAGLINTKGEYEYSWWIHHNKFKQPKQQSYITLHGLSLAVLFESSNSDAVVSYNHITNLGAVFAFDMVHNGDIGDVINNMMFYYNLCENIGFTDKLYGNFFNMKNYQENDVIENIFIYNNVFKGHNANSGIRLLCTGTHKNIFIYNNIIQGVRIYDIEGKIFGWLDIENYQPPHIPIEVSNIFIKNNIIYDNENDWFGSGEPNSIFYLAGIEDVVINLVEENNINDDPKYLSDTNLHLKNDSPAICSGVNVGLNLDFDGNVVGLNPCIGVYEYIN